MATIQVWLQQTIDPSSVEEKPLSVRIVRMKAGTKRPDREVDKLLQLLQWQAEAQLSPDEPGRAQPRPGQPTTH